MSVKEEIMDNSTIVDVYEMTDARDNRKKTQKLFIKNWGLPLITFTLNIPGPEKNRQIFRNIHESGIKDIESVFALYIKDKIIRNLKTGPEAYYVIDLDSNIIKTKTVEIENNNKMGRIFDMDVIKTNLSSLSRKNINMRARKCFLCDNNAFVCSRNRTHTVNELIEMIITLWKN